MEKIEMFLRVETGSGSGSGFGSVSGSGYDIKAINGLNIYNIDDVPTVITHVRGNIARGGILNSDLSISPCYIVKSERFFAHGETLKKAHSALLDKLLDNMTIEERNAALQKTGEFYQQTIKYQKEHNKQQLDKLKSLCAEIQFDLITNYGALESEEKALAERNKNV